MQYGCMNVVLKESRENGGYFIVSIIKEHDKFYVRTKRVDGNGNVLVWNDLSDGGSGKLYYSTFEEAKKRAKHIAKLKRDRKSMVNVQNMELPEAVKKQLAVCVDAQLNADEMMELLKASRKERYVTFTDVAGIEEYFDIGVEYVGNTTKDPIMMDVFDKFGNLKGILVSRLTNIRKTEVCLEAEGFR